MLPYFLCMRLVLVWMKNGQIIFSSHCCSILFMLFFLFFIAHTGSSITATRSCFYAMSSFHEHTRTMWWCYPIQNVKYLVKNSQNLPKPRCIDARSLIGIFKLNFFQINKGPVKINFSRNDH